METEKAALPFISTEPSYTKTGESIEGSPVCYKVFFLLGIKATGSFIQPHHTLKHTPIIAEGHPTRWPSFVFNVLWQSLCFNP